MLFNETETSEHLEYKPAELYVRVTVRHKGMRKDTNRIITAPVKNEPIPKSEDAAVIYSFMGCCKAADVDFKGWMNYFLYFGEKSQLLIDFDRNHQISSTFSETY